MSDDIFAPCPDKITPRRGILECYVENQVEYLAMRYPDVSRERLTEIVTAKYKERLKIPRCKVVDYPSEGNCELNVVSLGKWVHDHKADVIAPSGTVFKSDPDHVPPSVVYNNNCRLDRKKYKNMMFECIERGDTFGAEQNNARQNLKKTKNNSITGAHNFTGNPLYDKESFGAITSLGRNCIISTYTLTEQCLANNYHWGSREDIFNHIVTVSSYPDEAHCERIMATVKKFNLHIPTGSLVAKRLLDSARYYFPKQTVRDIYVKIVPMIDNLPVAKKIYLFYRRNLITLYAHNAELIREKLEKLRTIDTTLESLPDYNELNNTITPQDALKLPSDVSMMLAIIYNHVLDYKSVNADLVANHPDVAKRFAMIGKVALRYISELDEIYKPFMYTGERTPNVLRNRYIIRRSVAVSDTDSILFTLKMLANWYLKGNLRICQEGIDMAAYAVLVISRILNVACRDVFIDKGSVRENLLRMNLKSEFLYAIFVKTDLGKHYFTKYLSKEGRVSLKPTMDIKGVELQSSTLPEVSRKFASKVMEFILDEVVKHGNVYAHDLIGMCLEYEKKILNSLRKGELEYYTNTSVKEKAQYAKPESSIWFNYSLWQAIYAPDYGDIQVPGKCPIVPIKKGMFQSSEYSEWLRRKNPAMHERYVKAISYIKKGRNVGRLPISGDLLSLPEELIPLVNMRAIIYKNLTPAQLAIKQTGIAPALQKQMPLFMDYYCGLSDNILLTN